MEDVDEGRGQEVRHHHSECDTNADIHGPCWQNSSIEGEDSKLDRCSRDGVALIVEVENEKEFTYCGSLIGEDIQVSTKPIFACRWELFSTDHARIDIYEQIKRHMP